jgi:hypothetical protein
MRSWVMLLDVAVILTMMLYRFTGRPLVSAVVSAIVATGTLQLLVRAQLGYADPLWPVAATVSFGATFANSLVVVFAWRRFDRR